jgi:hypothetical protein
MAPRRSSRNEGEADSPRPARPAEAAGRERAESEYAAPHRDEPPRAARDDDFGQARDRRAHETPLRDRGAGGARTEPDRDADDRVERWGWRGKKRETAREEIEDDPLFARGEDRDADRKGDAAARREARKRGEEKSFREEALRFVDQGRKSDAPILDVDFEDIDGEGGEDRDRGFGRKIRADRRRATALARIDDLDPVAERVFNDEFFAALRVQPRELERAIRKARRRAEAREKNRITPLRALGWSAWIGMVAATGFVVYSYREDIVARFPSAAGAYAVVGIDAAPKGFRIERVNHRLAMSTGGPTIEITGALRNAGGAAMAPPLIQAEALGPGGELLSRWTFAVEGGEISNGDSAEFATRAPAPEGVAEVALSLAPDSATPRAPRDGARD